MKKISLISIITFAALIIATNAFAGTEDIQTEQEEKIVLSTKVPISFYGFVSAEALYTDSKLSSFGVLNNTPANYNKNITGFNRVVDETVEANNDAAISATVQNTRFGFDLAPYDFNGKNFLVDARIELDFFSTDNMSVHTVRPRIRRAYAGIGQKRWHVLVGQEWDLFSPLNTATLNIGGNLWQQGNLGSRRPQIQFKFNHPFSEEEQTSLEIAASINLPGNSMSLDDNGNTTGIPMLEGRVGVLHKLPAGEMKAYISALYARHKNAVAGASDINNWGIALSLEVPAHKFFIPSAEFQYGYSLSPLLALSSNTTRQRTIAAWGQIKSLWLKWFETNIGYGVDTLKNSQVAAGWVKRNQMGFASLRFKPHHTFVIGLEYNYLRTNYQGSGASEANVGFLNLLYFF